MLPTRDVEVTIFVSLILLAGQAAAGDSYLFAYFKDSGKSGVFYALSKDGFEWTLGRRQFKPDIDGLKRPKGIDGRVKEISRSMGTVQKDWAKVKSYDLRDGFCIAVVGHEGWNKNLEATAPYSLVISFEAVNSEISIYDAFVQVQQPLQVQQEVQLTVS